MAAWLTSWLRRHDHGDWAMLPSGKLLHNCGKNIMLFSHSQRRDSLLERQEIWASKRPKFPVTFPYTQGFPRKSGFPTTPMASPIEKSHGFFHVFKAFRSIDSTCKVTQLAIGLYTSLYNSRQPISNQSISTENSWAPGLIPLIPF